MTYARAFTVAAFVFLCSAAAHAATLVIETQERRARIAPLEDIKLSEVPLVTDASPKTRVVRTATDIATFLCPPAGLPTQSFFAKFSERHEVCNLSISSERLRYDASFVA